MASAQVNKGQVVRRMPAEWEPHKATWLAFPHHKTDFPGKLDAVKWTFAEMARVISEKEDVNLLCRDQTEAQRAKRTFLDAGVRRDRLRLLVCDTNRSWTRDTLPLWVEDGGPGTFAVSYAFDGWSRYRDHKLDHSAGQWVAARHRRPGKSGKAFGVPLRPDGSAAVLEGGSIDVDGQGTLLTTDECLLGDARGRFKRSAKEIPERRQIAEASLREWLGASKVIWLPDGIVGDDTSGHIDDFARFAPGGRVLLSSERDKQDANFEPLRRAKRALSGQTDARGRKLEVIDLPMPRRVDYRGERLPASYANFYIANAAVLVPVFNDPADGEALRMIQAAFPDRPVVGIYARDLVVGLGTLHCSSMQEPLGRSESSAGRPRRP